ncbi:MAG: hypothetical protein ACREKS_16180 [Candidatus Rokuibacteriota bacterium]
MFSARHELRDDLLAEPGKLFQHDGLGGAHAVYPAVSTVAGQPATAFPVGRSRAGLPLGLQAIGPYLEDRTPIRFAALLAQEIGGFRKPDAYNTS